MMSRPSRRVEPVSLQETIISSRYSSSTESDEGGEPSLSTSSSTSSAALSLNESSASANGNQYRCNFSTLFGKEDYEGPCCDTICSGKIFFVRESSNEGKAVVELAKETGTPVLLITKGKPTKHWTPTRHFALCKRHRRTIKGIHERSSKLFLESSIAVDTFVEVEKYRRYGKRDIEGGKGKVKKLNFLDASVDVHFIVSNTMEKAYLCG